VASVMVEVSTELLAELGEWSAPVQVKITSDGTRYDMVFRKVPHELSFRIPDVGPLDD
jgi:hypothetical protein